MKKIITIILAATALLAFAPVVSAQNTYKIADVINKANGYAGTPDFSRSATNTYTVKKNVAFSKQISEPLSDGTYWIKLEAFATGSATEVMTNEPADIVLVLDVSNSMNWSIDGKNPSQMSSSDTKRIDALKEAVAEFIELIDINDLYEKYVEEGSSENVIRSERLGNKIAIVTFNGSANTRQTLLPLTSKSALLNTVNNLSNYLGSGTRADLGLDEGYNLIKDLDDTHKLRTVVLFTDGIPTPSSNSSSYSWTDDTYNSFEWGNKAIVSAQNIKNLNDETAGIASNVFTVSVILNPDDYTNVYLGKTSSNWLKNTDSMGSYSTWNSSDIWSNGTGTKNTSETEYALSASSVEELINAFASIAAISGGASNKTLSSAASTVDVVSHSFKLPFAATDANTDKIKVFTAKCSTAVYTSGAETGEFTFYDEYLAPHNPNKYKTYDAMGRETGEEDVDNAITVNLSTDTSGDPVIKVTGFDYSNNWCGIKTSGTTQTVQGHKVMILIPIEMNPDAVGGPNVATNGPGSGIYVNEDDTETLIDFDSPTISLPVNIHIVKNGLRPGESAKFKIMRTTLPVSNESEWEYVTSVFVTNGEHTFIYEPTGAPVTYVRGLPSTKLVEGKQVGLVYRVEEEPWSWSYNRSTLPQYTNTENIDNPFTFENTKKDNIDFKIRHAESKATNTFHPVLNNENFDDSKTNDRSAGSTTTPDTGNTGN